MSDIELLLGSVWMFSASVKVIFLLVNINLRYNSSLNELNLYFYVIDS